MFLGCGDWGRVEAPAVGKSSAEGGVEICYPGSSSQLSSHMGGILSSLAGYTAQPLCSLPH